MSEHPPARSPVGIPEQLGSGVVVLCDAQTIVRHVIRDDVGLANRVEPRRSFVSLVDAESADNARRFLGAITTHGVAFDWGMTIATTAGAARLHFAGTTTSTGLLIVGAASVPALAGVCRALLQSGDDAVRGIRADLRALVVQAESAPTADQDLHDELRQLREDLAAAQRELGRRADDDVAARRDGDRAVAAALEETILSASLPQRPRLGLSAAHVRGSRHPTQGSSWYDAFGLPDGRIALVVGRVAGRGVQAVAAMSEVRAAIRTLAVEGHSPFSVLTRVDRVLRLSSGTPPSATAVLGLIDPSATTLTYSIAGHPAPVLGTPEGSVAPLRGDGWPLGSRTGELRPSRTVSLPDRGLLVFHAGIPTDQPAGAGETGLAAAVRAALEAESRDPADGVRRHLLGDVAPPEDAAILAVSIRPPVQHGGSGA